MDRTTCSHAHMGSFNQRPVATQKVYLTPRMTAVAVARALTRQAARAARMLAFAHKAAGPRRALVEAVPVPTQRRSGEEGSPSDASGQPASVAERAAGSPLGRLRGATLGAAPLGLLWLEGERLARLRRRGRGLLPDGWR